ncbi:MarR family winged helix-turn-helix transcriptional regulator [Klenkia sp. PcliD-1-E]|uniref:MarR family winged helix-turn-helix transcriptional regulator n=1 Tax=Klenkia sp. PcliD-1-E TaxID=2954492 RepID=UPI002097D100|nr:MarR family transcriptional regulator [Klenkia sp. PcliD-1-E]MCO7218283.1 MarR family transcriptional regulator [Klenkia sp. PcliD-1-E]
MQATGDADPELDEVLAWNLVQVARFVGYRMTLDLAGHGINPIQFGVLAFLSVSPEMTTSQIARAVLVRPQSMTPLLDGLEQRGLVRRTGTRARGRRNPVQITDAGRGLLRDARPVARATGELQDAGLGAEESRQLNQLLLKVVHATRDLPRPDASLYPADPDGF